MRKGLTLMEVMVSLVLLTLFIFGGMSLYATSAAQTKRSRILLAALWLAKGKIDSIAESSQPLVETKGGFDSPFHDYTFKITRIELPENPGLQLLVVKVKGPAQTAVKLERIVSF